MSTAVAGQLTASKLALRRPHQLDTGSEVDQQWPLCANPPTRIPHAKFLRLAQGYDRISELLSECKEQPFLLTRMGSAEQQVAHCFSVHQRPAPGAMKQVATNAGVYYEDDGAARDHVLKAYSHDFVKALRWSDLVATYSTPPTSRSDGFEASLVTKYCTKRPGCLAVSPGSLHNYNYTPWWSQLANKVVLVVHPFEKTIRSQYAKRHLVFPNDERALPTFELKTVRTYVSAVGRRPHANFSVTLERLKQDVRMAGHFDVALLGCGGYGLPLAGFIRSELKRSAMYLGGLLQVMFGIIGNRWYSSREKQNPGGGSYKGVIPPLKAIVNEHWTTPDTSEHIDNAEQLEGGSYFFTHGIQRFTSDPTASHWSCNHFVWPSRCTPMGTGVLRGRAAETRPYSAAPRERRQAAPLGHKEYSKVQADAHRRALLKAHTPG